MKDDADFLEIPAEKLAAPLFANGADDVLAALRAGLGDRYRVEREVGRGGMATVYLSLDVKHNRRVALKVLHPDLTPTLGAGRFEREIETIAGLRHPHILPLHDSGEVAGHLFYVMPFVEGESLRDRLNREPQLPFDDALNIASEVADALAYAHAKGIVHRDIKPENILLEGGHAVLADFGIARAVTETSRAPLTATGLALGTPAYMSPEQATGERTIDGRSDIYSLGCVVYEMLAGEPPFTGPTAQVVIARRLTELAPRVREARPSVPAEADAAIARAMAPVPADRFATADAFAEALVRTDAAVAAGERERARPALGARPAWRSKRAVIGAGIVAVSIAGTAAGVVMSRERAAVVPPAAAIAVLPPLPASADTALARLGRELAITLSANLDGVDGIRTADPLTVLAHVDASATPPALSDILELARRLGASSALHGSVLRAGDSVRLDLALHPADGGEPVARATVAAKADDITGLTNAATWAVLHDVWRNRGAPTPDLAAVTTRSIPALRAFLEGERQIVEGRWRSAPESFERALKADSTFWIAYWRYAFARGYWSAPVDPAIRVKYQEHRGELPERDRALIEAGMSDSLSVRYERTKAAAERFPNYWPAWWMLSEHLAHAGPLLGTSSRDLRAALERTLALNPRMTSAWEHLSWVASWDRDTALSAQIIQKLTSLRYDSVSRGEAGYDELTYMRYLDDLARGGGAPRDSTLVEKGLVELAAMTGPINPYSMGMTHSFYGFPREQVVFSRRLIARGVSPFMTTAQQLTVAVGQAARGAWDSSLVALDTFVARAADPVAPLYRYRVAVVGAWVGAIAPTFGAAPRAAAARERDRFSPAARAELAWLDGLLAVARNDTSALVAARRVLRTADSLTAPMLDRSLAAFAYALAGDRGRAADSLEALERERAELGWSRGRRSDGHPFLTAVDRLAAGRWLRERGDAARAANLLTWHEAVLAPLRETRQANVMVEGLAYLERARTAEAMGRHDLARDFYQRFLWRYDAPTLAHRHLVDEARRAQ